MEKIEIVQEDTDYLEYMVTHNDGGSQGSASLKLSELNETHHMAYQLSCEMILVGSRIAELFLYPHSETSQRHTGVASRVLDYILKDAAKRDIKAVFCEITNLDIRSFCQTRGFKGNYQPHCYKVLS